MRCDDTTHEGSDTGSSAGYDETGTGFTTRSAESTGANKANAIALGVSKIRLNDAQFANFIDDSKRKVISYYESQMSAIIAKAQNAAKARNFDEAIYILSEIPEECPSYPSKVAPLIQQYYKQEMDLYGEKLLAEARAAWAASPNAEGAARVAEILADMPPSCSSSAAAKTFVGQIGNKVASLEAWERKYLEREQAYRHDERKASIQLHVPLVLHMQGISQDRSTSIE